MSEREIVHAHRVDVVDGEGRVRMALFSPEHMPEIVIDGKAFPGRRRDQGKFAGCMFYDDEGNECGGLIFRGGATEGGHSQGLSLTFDAYMQDQVLQLFSEDEDGGRRYGVRLADRPRRPITEDIEQFDQVKRMADGPEREAALRAALDGHAERAFFGREVDGSVHMSLSDGEGRPRLRLRVESRGAAHIEFLDEDGSVFQPLGPEAPTSP